LDGLTLSYPICPHHVTQNQEVRVFANSFNNPIEIEDELKTGKAIDKYLIAKDYDMASKSCLKLMKSKIHKKDLRNAALIAKRMFDIMLDDTCLKGMTKDMKLLKDCSMTCYFLNAVICLYGNRYEEAIGYADMVLSRKACLEAMFIKGRALYELNRNDEAYDVIYQIISISKDGEEKKAIDKKLLLFEARVNERIGNSVLPIAKQLISLCPEFLSSYIMIRKEVEASGADVVFDPEEERTDILKAFIDKSVSSQDYLKMLKRCDDEKSMRKLRRALSKI
jgi:tetratricopeptide (TPR) repeat protein